MLLESIEKSETQLELRNRSFVRLFTDPAGKLKCAPIGG